MGVRVGLLFLQRSYPGGNSPSMSELPSSSEMPSGKTSCAGAGSGAGALGFCGAALGSSTISAWVQVEGPELLMGGQ